jgi:hypothetical protein
MGSSTASSLSSRKDRPIPCTLKPLPTDRRPLSSGRRLTLTTDDEYSDAEEADEATDESESDRGRGRYSRMGSECTSGRSTGSCVVMTGIFGRLAIAISCSSDSAASVSGAITHAFNDRNQQKPQAERHASRRLQQQVQNLRRAQVLLHVQSFRRGLAVRGRPNLARQRMRPLKSTLSHCTLLQVVPLCAGAAGQVSFEFPVIARDDLVLAQVGVVHHAFSGGEEPHQPVVDH